MDEKIILAIEDDPKKDIELARKEIKRNNILNKVIALKDGEEALDYLFSRGKYSDKSSARLPELIFLDLNLPKVDGFEVLQEIREKQRTVSLPVAIFTASKKEEDIIKSYNLGANTFIRKPITFKDISKVIKNLGLHWIVVRD